MKVLERSYTDKEDVRHMGTEELSRLGVSLVDRQNVTLRCNVCGETWSPQLDANGKLPFDYWQCPAHCNR